MKKSTHCPLCSSDETQVLEVISGECINSLYLKAFEIPNALKAKQLDYHLCDNCDLSFFTPMETGEGELYEKLQTYDWYYLTKKQEFDIAMRYLDSIESILEVGAGKAAFASVIGKEKYTGLEFNELAIDRAKVDGVYLIKESVEKHALNEKKYDAVVSFQVLEHIENPFEFIKGCLGCLAKGGTLILAVPSKDGFSAKMVNNVLDMPPHHVTHWSVRTFKKIAEMFDIECLSIEHELIADYHAKLAKKIYFERKLRSIFSIKPQMIDVSFFSKIITKIANILSIFFTPSLSNEKGHTVVAVYKKR